jgi:hypothetical protein
MWRDRGRKNRQGRQRYEGEGDHGPAVIYGCGGIEVVRAGRDAGATKARMQDFGVGAFNGWDDFQDMIAGFITSIDWRCGTELDFADDGLFSGGKKEW